MANILIIGEHADGRPKKVTLELISKAAELASKLSAGVDVAFIGKGLKDLSTLGPYGARRIFTVGTLDRYNTEGYTKILAEIAKESGCSVILGTASPMGKDLLPRLAARLGAGLATDCTDLAIEGDRLKATRPIFAGKAFIDVTFETPIQTATARPNSFIPKESSPGAKAEVIEKNIDPGPMRATLREVLKGAADKADLTEASIIVSGGRAMKSAENFKILQELADSLGATVGASRAAVDSGYAPHDMQVGQTGKTVNPKLYIACGISGAIQHLAGMRTSKVIVAINSDPNAPLFQKADYGIAGDLFQIVPMLTQEFKKVILD